MAVLVRLLLERAGRTEREGGLEHWGVLSVGHSDGGRWFCPSVGGREGRKVRDGILLNQDTIVAV